QSSAAPAAWRMPPELNRYLPREVLWSAAGWVLGALIFVLVASAVGATAGLWIFGERSAAQAARLDTEGIRTTAVVVEARRMRGDSPRRWSIRYRYEVGGQFYFGEQRLRTRDTRSAGSLVPIRYLPA